MIQVYKDSNKMNILHKDKERIRHHRQVKLLNEVMEHVPVSPIQAKTKIKKLRHLVLYTRYLKMVHSQVTERLSSTIEDNNKCVSDEVSKPVTKLGKVCHQKGKHQKAHIVFLQADKSANLKENIHEKALSTDHAKIDYTRQEFTLTDESKSHYHQSVDKSKSYHHPSVDKFGYRIPDVAVFDGRINNIDSNHKNSSPTENFNTQVNTDTPVSSDKYEISPHSIFITPFERKYGSNLSTEGQIYHEKENFPPVATNYPVIKQIFKSIPVQTVDRFTQNMIVNDRNLMNNGFHEISQRYPDNYILRDLTCSGDLNKSFDNSNVVTSAQTKDYLLNPYQDNALQNVSDIYEYQVSPADLTCESSILSNNLYFSDYFVNSLSFRPQSCKPLSPIGENMSDNSNSSSSTNKLNIDLEDLSDSNPSYTNLSDISSSLNATYYDSPSWLYCDSMRLPVEQVLPGYNTIKQKHKQVNSNITPKFSLINSLSENHPLENEIVFTPLSHSYPCDVYPTNFSFNENCTVMLPPESVHSVPDRNIQFVSDSDSLYSPSSENMQSNTPFQPMKSEIVHSDYLSASFQNSTKPSFFEDEASYSLAQYLRIGECPFVKY